MNELQVFGLITLATMLVGGAFVLVRLRKQREIRRADAERNRDKRIRAFDADAREFLQSDDKRVQACGRFIAKSVERADQAAACHVAGRAEQHIAMMAVARFHGSTLKHFPEIDSPHGVLTTRLLTGLELVRSGKHTAAMEELTPLVVGEAVPMLVQRAAFRAGLISAEMRGIVVVA